jgi:hypothetical protein
MARSRRERAQSLLEYVFIFAIIVSGIIAMQVYIKRGMQGGMRNSANQFSPSPYVRGATTSTSTTQITGSTIEYSGVTNPVALKYPHDAISYETTTATSQETSPIGVGGVQTKETQSSTSSTRKGVEHTDNDFVTP